MMMRARLDILMYPLARVLDEDEDLVIIPILLPPLSPPVVYTVSPAVTASFEAGHLRDHLGLLLQQGHVVGQEDDLLLLSDLVTHVFDQHHSDERFPTSCSQVDYNVPSLGLL